jgi:hypothetical protein
MPGQDDFVEVVAPTDSTTADRLFEEWLAEHRLSRSDLPEDDIRIDLIRMRDGRSAKRYRVRTSFGEKSVGGPKFKLASSEQTERAREAIDEFLDAVIPAEERPYIVTDLANVFDVTTLSADEIKERCLRIYGVRLSEEDLGLPLWKLVEHLKRGASED